MYDADSDESRVIDDPKQLLDIKIDRSYFINCGNDNRSFDRGISREEINKIYNINSNYLLIRTIANPKAEKILKNSKIKAIERFDSKKEFKAMHIKDANPLEIEKLTFAPKLMEVYIEALSFLARSRFGKSYYTHYNLISTHGICSQRELPESIYWPEIHIIKDTKKTDSKNFRTLVDKLNDDKAYLHIKSKQNPWNYNMGEIKFLRNKKVLPLIVEPREYYINGKELKDAIDFLVLFTLSEESRCPFIDDD